MLYLFIMEKKKSIHNFDTKVIHKPTEDEA